MASQKSIAVARVGVVLAGVMLASVPATAQDVGTATAVNPLSQGAAPGVDLVTLNVGARIVHRERIKTTPSGTVQLLFVDKSTMSIAPNTDILIDDYVFNPRGGSGHMAVTLARGALRFVGGLLSHQGAADLTTPAAAIGIRGGTATIIHDRHGTRVIDHYGVITIHNGGGTVEIRRPGFAVTILNWNAVPGEPQRVTAAEIDNDLKLLTSKPWENGGVPGLTNAPFERLRPGGLRATIGPDDLPVFTGKGESDAFQLIIQATQHGTGRGVPPPPTRLPRQR